MILVRNCPYDNGIYTLIDKPGAVVIKSSYSSDGMARLGCEYEGNKWYFGRKYSCDEFKPSVVIERRSGYTRLTLRLFPGSVGDYDKGLTQNKSRLLAAINAYEKIWPSDNGGLAPLHGDFSLGNMIFHKNDINIIDWEHFRLDTAPWGFDLLNLIYESAFFSFGGRGTLRHADAGTFGEIRKAVLTLLVPSQKFRCTLDELTEFISVNRSIWGPLVNKLPVMKFNIEQRKYLKQLEAA
jgi:hypothetical protein